MRPRTRRAGYAHFALSTGSVEAVNHLTEQLRQAGVPIIDGPRWTGDGYYEAVILDPDGNHIEITI
jgi:lactoylglutathione lyase